MDNLPDNNQTKEKISQIKIRKNRFFKLPEEKHQNEVTGQSYEPVDKRHFFGSFLLIEFEYLNRNGNQASANAKFRQEFQIIKVHVSLLN